MQIGKLQNMHYIGACLNDNHAGCGIALWNAISSKCLMCDWSGL